MISNHIFCNSPLQVLLEGRIFEEQPLGGISRIYHEILPRMCQMDERIRFSILSSGHLLQPLPQHPRVVGNASKLPVDRFLRPKIIFWQLQDYLRAKLQIASIDYYRNSIWHATYFQLPNWWEGPKVTSVYDLIYEKYPEFFNRYSDNILLIRKKRSILAADKVICISKSVRSEVIETYGLPQERVIAIPLACGDRFRKMSKEEIAPHFHVDQPFILYVGSRHPYKNFTTLLGAYTTWPRRREVKLLVVGKHWSEEELKQIAAAGLQSDIICRSNISDEELCALYNQALAFVYPSLSEGFGIPLLEAMACGCPIVASRIPTSTEIARDVPYYFDPLNKDELIAALDTACFSEETKSKEDILANYSWDRTAQATLNVYKELTPCA
jgi:glycosyltransferase involved in cell wall biosynthesis